MKFVFIIILLYYGIIYLLFNLNNGISQASSPTLIKRLGTILWHGPHLNNIAEDLVYCYYPSRELSLSKFFPTGSLSQGMLRGEEVIKKVQTINDCRGWHGAAFFKDDAQLSLYFELHKDYSILTMF